MSTLSPLRSQQKNLQSPNVYSPTRLELMSRLSTLGISSPPTIRRYKSSPNITAEKRPCSTSSSQSETTKKKKRKVVDKIQVFIRKRPLNKQELKREEQDIVTVDNKAIHINAPRLKFDLSSYTNDHSFHFDGVFSDVDSNENIYQKTTYPLVEYMFNGGKSTIFAYGQTGSGKTYTMLNPKHGLYTMAAKDIFDRIQHHNHLTVYISYYEIYQSQLYDLLNHRKKLTPRDDGKGNIIIANLKEFPVNSYDEMMQVLCFGNQERTTGKTGANQTSSRSHAILNLSLFEGKKKVFGKLNFIDLAGSERASDRGEGGSGKTRMMEGAEINKSLLALKECIRALTQDNKFPPFRTSKLTLVLRDSFIGNSRTCMIATISPNVSNSEHTLNTLRYADRLKELKEEMAIDFMYEDDNDVNSIPSTNALNIIKPSLAPPTTTTTVTNIPTIITTNTKQGEKEEKQEKIVAFSKKNEYYSPTNIIYDDNKEGQQDEETGIPYSKDQDYPSLTNLVNDNKGGKMEKDDGETTETTKNRITRSYIRHFTRLHKQQINDIETYLEKSKQLEKDISHLFTSTDWHAIPKLYTQYQRDLSALLDNKQLFIKELQDKIEQEFE